VLVLGGEVRREAEWLGHPGDLGKGVELLRIIRLPVANRDRDRRVGGQAGGQGLVEDDLLAVEVGFEGHEEAPRVE
jgi:hypothetical protein